MKVLFYRYGSICEPDLLDAFKELGHTVYEFSVEIYTKNLSPKESIPLVGNALLKQHTDCVFSINFYPFLAKICTIFKIRYICWTVDSPILELYSTAITEPYNRIFLFDHAQYEDVVTFNPKCIFHMPLAANVKSKKKPLSSTPNSTLATYKAPVSFVGSLYSEKCPYDAHLPLPNYVEVLC